MCEGEGEGCVCRGACVRGEGEGGCRGGWAAIFSHLLLLFQLGAGLSDLVEQSNILCGVPAHTVSIIAHPDQQGTEEDGIVKTVACLALQYQGW